MSLVNGEINSHGRITRFYQQISHLHNAVPYRLSKAGTAFPAWHYFFEVTRRCNLRCKMCQYIDWLENVPIPEQRDGELSTEEWLDVIDQTGPFSLITFTGGEVFVRKDFMTILKHACSKRRVHFISNATMMKEDRARELVELAPKFFGMPGLNFIGVSIDGTQEVHDVIRAQEGSFEKSTEGMKRIAKIRDELGRSTPWMHMNFVMQNENLEDLPEMPRIAKECGAKVLNLLTEIRSFDNPELGFTDPAPLKNEVPPIPREALDRQMTKALENGQKLGIEVRLPRMPYEEVLNHYDQGYDLDKFQCRSIWTNLYVGSKGGVYPCFIQKVGNVRENSLKEIWNGEDMRAFRRRRREMAFEVCRGCCEIEYKGEGKNWHRGMNEGNGKQEETVEKKGNVLEPKGTSLK